MNPSTWWRSWTAAALSLFRLRACLVCGQPLLADEVALCTPCMEGLPRTRYHLMPDNPAARRLWGRFPLERATSLFFYRRGSSYARLLWDLKFSGRRSIGHFMGARMARELQSSGFFQGIDLILPVPLHRYRLWQRGYNQSLCLARGVSQVTGIPVDTHLLRRIRSSASQRSRAGIERWDNVCGIFSLRQPGALAGKHILLIDDVLTTGSTLTACADALSGEAGIRISVLTLALADE